MRKGIDVSSYQGDIDWEETKNYIDFVIIRCGYGNNITSQDDTKYQENARECTRLKIPFGVYLYSYATNLKMAESEVAHTLRLIKDYKLEYPVFLDVEDRSQLSLPKEQLIEIVKYYCEKIESAGYYVGIYASLSTLNGILNSSELDPYDKWVAEWGKDFNYKGSSGLWQHTDNERVSGINTRVDGDIAFYDYPEIIRKNGLNHLETGEEEPKPPETVELKYKVGDTLYLNGPLYQTKEGRKIIRRYRNKQVMVKSVDNNIGVSCPYELNVNGYTKEQYLTQEKLPRCSIHIIILEWLRSIF